MKLTLKKNDSLQMMCSSLGYSQDMLIEKVISQLMYGGLIMGIKEDCGLSLTEVASRNGYKVNNLLRFLLPNVTNFTEVKQLTDNIIIWGTENECDECGCKMIEATEESFGHSWKNYFCENPYCSNKTSGEPDWDNMKGGVDYGR